MFGEEAQMIGDERNSQHKLTGLCTKASYLLKKFSGETA